MAAYETINGIKEAKAQIAGLRKILQEMDPASGVSISIRRGVSRDNPDVEDDATRRPWVTVETADLTLAKDAIQAALIAADQSLDLRIKLAQNDHRILGEFLANMEKP